MAYIAQIRDGVERITDQIEKLELSTTSTLEASLEGGMLGYADDGTPVYPDARPGYFVPSGTWLTGDLSYGFIGSAQFSIEALLDTRIRGYSTQGGWSGRSDEGFGVTAKVAAMSLPSKLAVPKANRDCNWSAVTLSGNAEHTAEWAVGAKIGDKIEVSSYYRVAGSSLAEPKTCGHTPLEGEMIGPSTMRVGESAPAGALWRGSYGSQVVDCPTRWSVYPGATASLDQGDGSPANDSRKVTALAAGTATITAECRGYKQSFSLTVSPACSGGGGGGEGGSGDGPDYSMSSSCDTDSGGTGAEDGGDDEGHILIICKTTWYFSGDGEYLGSSRECRYEIHYI